MLNTLKGSIISLCTCSMYSGIACACMPSVSAGLFSLPIGVLRNVESKVPNHNSSLVVIRKEWKWYAKLYTWTINNYSSSQCIQNLVEHDNYLTKTYGKVSGYANKLNYHWYIYIWNSNAVKLKLIHCQLCCKSMGNLKYIVNFVAKSQPLKYDQNKWHKYVVKLRYECNCQANTLSNANALSALLNANALSNANAPSCSMVNWIPASEILVVNSICH